MTDLEILQQFYQQISWADQCREVSDENFLEGKWEAVWSWDKKQS
ncbi:hypothetical protein [Nostoc sp. MG11]|nr:hypothetical protein [Nostoc sp. MG11]